MAMSSGSGFATEQPELPLQTSMAPSVPLPMTANDQSQPPLRSQYTYTSSAPPLSGNHVSIGGPDAAFSMPRYVDSNPRPSKSPRHSGHQSVHSSGSISNTENSSDYRYGSYRTSNSGPSEVSQAPGYASESSGATGAPSRDYYPPSSSTWTTTAPAAAAESNSGLSYAGTDGRSYSFSSQEPYKSGASSLPPSKHETGAPSGVYGGGSRGSFDTMNNYSWNAT